MAKYIKCDHCGKRIDFGQDVYTDKDGIGIYCSEHCYCEGNAYTECLDEKLASDMNWPLWDDDERREEIRKEMERHRMAMEKLFEELKTLTTQN